MASAKKVLNPTHRAVRRIKHDGAYYAPNDPIALTDEQAEDLGSNVEALRTGSASDAINLQALTKEQLINHASDVHGLDLAPSATKAELISAIDNAAGKTDAQ